MFVVAQEDDAAAEAEQNVLVVMDSQTDVVEPAPTEAPTDEPVVVTQPQSETPAETIPQTQTQTQTEGTTTNETAEETSSVSVEVAEDEHIVENAPVSCEDAEYANPWILSDLDDYPPGALVTLYGAGWVPGQTVELLIDDDGIADAEMGQWSHSAIVSADVGGRIYYQFNIAPLFVLDYTVVATGQCSEARTAFTDANTGMATVSPTNVSAERSQVFTVTLANTSNPSDPMGCAEIQLNGFAVTAVTSQTAGWTATTRSATVVRMSATSDSNRINAGAQIIVAITATAPTTVGPTSWTFEGRRATNCTAAPFSFIAQTVNVTPSCTAPLITEHPLAQIFVYGPDATFTAAATGSPTPTVQWQRSTDNGGSWTDIDGEIGTTLTLTKPDVSQSGTQYRAVFTNSCDSATTRAATLTVSHKSQTITFETLSDKVFGDAPFTISATATSGLRVSFTRSGPGGCEVSSPSTLVDGRSVATVTITGAGSCQIAAFQNGDANHLGAPTVYQTFTIAQATATVTLSDLTHVFDGRAKAPTVTTGPVGLGPISVTFNGLTAPPTNAGSYGVVATLNHPNYSGQATGILVITKRPITVTVDSTKKVYGDTNPELTYKVTSGEVVEGDSFTGSLKVTSSDTVGKYVIELGTLKLNDNYIITFEGADLEVTARPITVTADAKSKVYGDADPGLTYTPSDNLVDGDAFSGELSRVSGENVGPHTINQGTLGLNSNYDLTFVPGILTITPRPITVTADAQSKVYGAADPALTYSYDEADLIDGDEFSGKLIRVAGENVGKYAIGQGTLALSDNYDLKFFGAELEITPAPLTVDGFFKPIDMGGVQNVAKAGSTIPFKFRVYEADGTEITDPNRIKVVVRSVACQSAAPQDAVEETSSAATSLRYEDGKFIFNWKTPKAGKGCYEVKVEASGSNYTIPDSPVAIVTLR